MQISPKLRLYSANQGQIRNQGPRLRRNTLFIGRKAGGGCKVVPKYLYTVGWFKINPSKKKICS